MKIIHTSDWHLGQNLFGFDRRDDHEEMINQLAELVSEEKPDALIVAGDVFDVATPGTGVQRDLANYMVKLHNACPEMMIVCISGNHDSASRHEIFQSPWEALGVKMVGKANKEDLAENIIEVPGKGWIVTVPYTNDRFLSKEFYTGLEEKTMEMAGVSSPASGEPQKAEGLPIIYVGHAAIKDTDYSGHQKQNDRFIGGIECTGIDEIGKQYDYIALGHIHKAQTFDGGRARYCGTPLAVSFDEVREGYEHGFDVVEIEAHGTAPKIRTVPMRPWRPLMNIPAEGHAEWDDVIEELRSLPDDLNAFVRLNVLLKSNELLPFNKDTVIQTIMDGKKARVAVINPKRESLKSDEGEDSLGTLTMEELQKIDHKTILKEYAKQKGFEFTKEYEEMFELIFKIVSDPDYEDK